MRFLISLPLLIILTGCGFRGPAQEQAASDAVAGIRAAQDLIATKQPEVAIAVLDASVKYVEAAVDTPTETMPVPKMQPARIAENPSEYIKAAPPKPEPWGTGVWAGLSAAALAALFGVRKVAPLVPGGGQLIGFVADALWDLVAHKDQKAADEAQRMAAEAARVLYPLMDLVANSPNLAPSLQAYITPEVRATLVRLGQSANIKANQPPSA